MKYRVSYVFLGILVVSLSSCGKREVPGNGTVETQARTIQSFKAVKLSGDFNVQLQGGNSYQLNVTTDSNLLPFINSTVDNGTLFIDNKGNYQLSPTKGIQVAITAPDFSKIEASGAINLTANQISATNLELDVSGAVKATLSGVATNLVINGSGACKIDAKNLVAQNVTVRSSGACGIMVNANKSLDLKTSGASKVVYYGSAEVEQKTSGVSSVTSQATPAPSTSQPTTKSAGATS